MEEFDQIPSDLASLQGSTEGHKDLDAKEVLLAALAQGKNKAPISGKKKGKDFGEF